jgi:hypothetical protein
MDALLHVGGQFNDGTLPPDTIMRSIYSFEKLELARRMSKNTGNDDK